MADEPNVEEVMLEVESPSVREILEKNFAKHKDDPEPEVEGTPTEPAKGKSFVNDVAVKEEVVEKPQTPSEYSSILSRMDVRDRQAFNALTPEMQRFVANQTLSGLQTFQRRMDEVVKKEKEHEELTRVITPEVREELSRYRLSVPQIVDNALAWDKAFRVNKNGAAIEYLQAQGVDLHELYRGFSDGSLYQPSAPEYMTKEQMDEYWREKQEAAAEERRLQEEQIALQQKHSVLDSFLTNPVFAADPEVSDARQIAVAREVRILREVDGFQGSDNELLEKALKQAIDRNPNGVFSGIQQQAAIPQDTNIYKKMEKVRAAKAASRSISGSPGSGSPVQKASSLRENLEQNFFKS